MTKIQLSQPSESLPRSSLLDPGDRVTVSVSHQIFINGDQSWVKLEINGQVREGEASQEAIGRIHGEVLNNIMGIIEDNVAMVEEQGEEK
jgi:hypothetical protein